MVVFLLRFIIFVIMKHDLTIKLFAVLFMLAGATSCTEKKTQSTQTIRADTSEVSIFGQLSEDTIAYKPERIFEKLMFQNDFRTIVMGKVKNCSKDSGNWFTLEANSEALFVEVKDNAFVLPTNLEGKEVAVHGNVNVVYGKNGEQKVKILATGVQFLSAQ